MDNINDWDDAGLLLLHEQSQFKGVGDVRATDWAGTTLNTEHHRWKCLLDWCLDAYDGKIFRNLQLSVRANASAPVSDRQVWPSIRRPNGLDSDFYLWTFVSVVYRLELDYAIDQWKRGNRQPVNFTHLVLRHKSDFQAGMWHRFGHFWEPFIPFAP